MKSSWWMICVVICLKKVMEVGGKKLDKDLPNSSDEVLPPHCQPCSNDGELLPAEGFCETCAEYLCDTCYKAHTIPTPSRNHVLLDKKQILRNSFNTKVKPKPSLCTIRCTEHPEEIVKFYCQTLTLWCVEFVLYEIISNRVHVNIFQI